MPKNKPNDFQKVIRRGVADLINSLNGRQPKPAPPPPPEHSEAWYRDRLAKKLNGKTEVSTPSGRIDILTKTEIIEVKNAKGWKSAIGQVKSYGRYYPNHRLRIHLFGQISKNKLEIIQKDCEAENITLTWE